MSFVEKFGLWTEAQHAAALHVLEELKARNIEIVRFSFPDQHGLLRGKTLVVAEAANALRNGVTMTTTMFAKDTSHRTVFPVFSAGGGFDMPEMQGAADVLMIPDPTTFKVLPWAPHTGWFLCDVYFSNGNPVPFATRQLFRNALDRLSTAGYDFMAGLEVEFHIFKVKDPRMQPGDAGQPGEPPDVSLLSHGYQFLTELRYDQIDPVLELIRKDILKLGLPLRSLEVEYGPSQVEFTFAPAVGLQIADDMILFRSAVKQICQRNGYHATFMCRPRIPNVISSGWHMHQSLLHSKDKTNAFMPQSPGADLSDLGRHYMAGLLEHACGATALSTPTINGYKRYRAYSLAPDRAIWGRDNRGVMVRVLGGANDAATRLENRVGEPAANPYLYFSSQVLSGLDGIRRELEPGPSADAPYETPAQSLPYTLSDAIECLRNDACLREGLGAGFVNYFCKIKEAEISRFSMEVSEWEQKEYFNVF